MRVSAFSLATLVVTALVACVHIDDVRVASIEPRYLRPIPASRSAVPVALVYDPQELPDTVTLSGPEGLPHAKLLGARSLVTAHLRRGLESLFEHVSVVGLDSQAPQDGLLCTVHFVDAGLAMAPGGRTLVGTLEWSVALTRPGQPRVLYSWGERTVGTREGAGSFGMFDPAPVVQGAVEASLRAMLKDMDAKGVVAIAASDAPAAEAPAAAAAQPK